LYAATVTTPAPVVNGDPEELRRRQVAAVAWNEQAGRRDTGITPTQLAAALRGGVVLDGYEGGEA
jgi:hypothetical protein